MSIRSQVAFVIDAARNAFRTDEDTTTECAHDLYKFLTGEPWRDYTRTEPYYVAIVDFVRNWQPAAARQGSGYL